ncbi:MAG: hypothetical protein WC349_00760 [Patescibacteria group bacterium]|jgi:hypothetical protein
MLNNLCIILSNWCFLSLIIITIILICIFIIVKLFQFNKIIKIDENYRKYSEDGKILEQGNPRNIWDYHFFSGISKLVLGAEWHKTIILILLVILIFLYLKTKDELFKTLLITDFGIIIGAIIDKSIKK